MKVNYKIECERAFKFAKKTIIAGSNWGPEIKLGINCFVEDGSFFLKDETKEQRKIRKSTKKLARDFVRKNSTNPLEYIENEILNIFKYSIGNCDEFFFVLCYYGLLNNVLVEELVFSNLDHTAGVFGRDLESDPHDPNTWNAWICDPWYGRWFHSSKLHEEYQGLSELAGPLETRINEDENRNIKTLKSLRTFDLLKSWFSQNCEQIKEQLQSRRSHLSPDSKAVFTPHFQSHIETLDKCIRMLTQHDRLYQICFDEAEKEFKKLPQGLDIFSLTRKNLLTNLDYFLSQLDDVGARYELTNLIESIAKAASYPEQKKLLSFIAENIEKEKNIQFDAELIRRLFKNILWISLQQTTLDPVHPLPSGELIKNQLNSGHSQQLLKLLNIEVTDTQVSYADLEKYITGKTNSDLLQHKFFDSFNDLLRLPPIHFLMTEDSAQRIAYRENGCVGGFAILPADALKLPIEARLTPEDAFHKAAKEKNFYALGEIINSYPEIIDRTDYLYADLLIAVAKESDQKACLRAILTAMQNSNQFLCCYVPLCIIITEDLAGEEKLQQAIVAEADSIITVPPSLYPPFKTPPFKDLLATTRLFKAIETGAIAKVIEYIEEKTYLTYHNQGESAVFCAIRNNQTAILQELIKHGIDVNCKESGYSPLHYALYKEHLECAQLLLDAGAKVNTSLKTYDGLTSPLTQARKICAKKHPSIGKIIALIETALEKELPQHKTTASARLFPTSAQSDTLQIPASFSSTTPTT